MRWCVLAILVQLLRLRSVVCLRQQTLTRFLLLTMVIIMVAYYTVIAIEIVSIEWDHLVDRWTILSVCLTAWCWSSWLVPSHEHLRTSLYNIIYGVVIEECWFGRRQILILPDQMVTLRQVLFDVHFRTTKLGILSACDVRTLDFGQDRDIILLLLLSVRILFLSLTRDLSFVQELPNCVEVLLSLSLHMNR